MKKYLHIRFKPACNCLLSMTSSRTTATTTKKDKVIATNCDLVGQPDPVSNLRTIKFYVPKDENEIERKYRMKREEVQRWNEEFWTNHNKNFIKERKEFIDSHKKQYENTEEPISADKLSIFYKRFLDKNWKIHLNYNYEWYKKNAMLVLLAVQVNLSRLKEVKFKNK